MGNLLSELLHPDYYSDKIMKNWFYFKCQLCQLLFGTLRLSMMVLVYSTVTTRNTRVLQCCCGTYFLRNENQKGYKKIRNINIYIYIYIHIKIFGSLKKK